MRYLTVFGILLECAAWISAAEPPRAWIVATPDPKPAAVAVVQPAAPVYRVEYYRDGRGRLYQRIVMDAAPTAATVTSSPCPGGVCPLPRR